MNCLTKEEFERSSRSGPALERQSSQVHSPLSSSLSFNEVIRGPEVEGGLNQAGQVSGPSNGAQVGNEQNYDHGNKAMALVMQPSVDYGKSKSEFFN